MYQPHKCILYHYGNMTMQDTKIFMDAKFEEKKIIGNSFKYIKGTR